MNLREQSINDGISGHTMNFSDGTVIRKKEHNIFDSKS